jgi:regulator of RNase E activity RraA
VTFHDARVDATITPGDWIVGDLNGVICIPQAIVSKVVELLPQLGEAESKIEADIDNGATFAVASKEHCRK